MRILLTNDDGYDAPGLRALFEAVQQLADVTVDVIAPYQVQSGKGHVVSDRFRFWHAEVEGIGRVCVVDGSPPDCVRAGAALPGRARPDWVISGINHGSNLGIDIYNSGTVAAAREAGFLGIPALAISQFTRRPLPDDWPRTASEASAVVAAMIQPQHPCPPAADRILHAQVLAARKPVTPEPEAGSPHRWWNINLPRLEAGARSPGARITSISREPYALDYCIKRDADGVEYCENMASYHSRPATEGTDVAAVFNGWVSLSPLNWSDYRF